MDDGGDVQVEPHQVLGRTLHRARGLVLVGASAQGEELVDPGDDAIDGVVRAFRPGESVRIDRPAWTPPELLASRLGLPGALAPDPFLVWVAGSSRRSRRG